MTMKELKFGSHADPVRIAYFDRNDSESASAWFGLCFVIYNRSRHAELTTVSTPTDWNFDGITIHPVNGGAVLTLSNGNDRVVVNLTGITPEALCDAVEAARLQEVAE